MKKNKSNEILTEKFLNKENQQGVKKVNFKTLLFSTALLGAYTFGSFFTLHPNLKFDNFANKQALDNYNKVNKIVSQNFDNSQGKNVSSSQSEFNTFMVYKFKNEEEEELKLYRQAYKEWIKGFGIEESLVEKNFRNIQITKFNSISDIENSIINNNKLISLLNKITLKEYSEFENFDGIRKEIKFKKVYTNFVIFMLVNQFSIDGVQETNWFTLGESEKFGNEKIFGLPKNNKTLNEMWYNKNPKDLYLTYINKTYKTIFKLNKDINENQDPEGNSQVFTIPSSNDDVKVLLNKITRDLLMYNFWFKDSKKHIDDKLDNLQREIEILNDKWNISFNLEEKSNLNENVILNSSKTTFKYILDLFNFTNQFNEEDGEIEKEMKNKEDFEIQIQALKNGKIKNELVFFNNNETLDNKLNEVNNLFNSIQFDSSAEKTNIFGSNFDFEKLMSFSNQNLIVKFFIPEEFLENDFRINYVDENNTFFNFKKDKVKNQNFPLFTNYFFINGANNEDYKFSSIIINKAQRKIYFNINLTNSNTQKLLYLDFKE